MSETERPSARLWNLLVLLKENLIWSIPRFVDRIFGTQTRTRTVIDKPLRQVQ